VRALLIGLALAGAAPASAGPLDRWSGQISEASSRFGIPAEWIRRVIRAESGGRIRIHGRPVVSSAGAMGLMQLMPATWRSMRDRLGLGPDPHDPRDNILAGAAYLRLMYDRFGYPGLFAAYNAGPSRYSAWLSEGTPLPAETRAYVAALSTNEGEPALPRVRPRAALFAIAGQGRARPVSARDGVRSPSDDLFVQLNSASGR
jgi:soluble lytic murein transglycosylase-like protein